MLNELGEFLGQIIIILYIFTILNYFVKFINRTYREQLSKNKNVFEIFTKIMKFIVKNHKIFGLLTVVFLLLHFVLEYSKYGFRVSGLIAAGTMLLQVAIGIYGIKFKRRGTIWLISHRLIAIIVFIAILIHTA